MATVFCVGYGIDVPVSCVTDTICLPYDLWACRKTRLQKEQKEKTKANQASHAIGAEAVSPHER